MSHRDRDYDRQRSDDYRSRDRGYSSRGTRDDYGRRDRYRQDDDEARHGGRSSRDDRRRYDNSPTSYDAEYESRKFRDRRTRELIEKYGRRSRSRSREEDSSRRNERRGSDYESSRRKDSSREHRPETSSYSDDSSRDYANRERETKEEETHGATSSTDDDSRRRNRNESDYLAKMSDEKLQETYERYENDPNFDITDGLLDNIVIDKEKIHREMQERLRQHLASEGKVYPPPKPEPVQNNTIFANDGSFMEMFKKMQEQQQGVAGSSSTATEQVVEAKPVEVKRPAAPMYGKRRGGKILKTGIVAKKKPIEDASADAAPGDAWSQYMKEVKRYKSVSCDVDNKTRPLVK